MIKFKNQRGFSLVGLAMAVGLLAITSISMVTFTKMTLDADGATRTKQSLNQAKMNVVDLVSNQDIWVNHIVAMANQPNVHDLVKYNCALECLTNSTIYPSGCAAGAHPLASPSCPVPSNSLTVLDGSDVPVVNAQDGTLGFTRDGSRCTTFGTDTSPEGCIYRIEISWNAICPKGLTVCKDPQIALQFNLKNTTNNGVTSLGSTPFTIVPQSLKGGPPIVQSTSVLANSNLYYPTENHMVSIDVTALGLISTYSSNITVSVSGPQATTMAGGTVSVAQKTVGSSRALHWLVYYTPPSSTPFYGMDTFTYTVTDNVSGQSSNGTVWAKVMTPYTWTGGQITDLGAPDPSTLNRKNFCGKVQKITNSNGVDSYACDRRTWPQGNYYGWRASDFNYVFNELCDPCTVHFDTNFANAIRMSSQFRGDVYLNTDLSMNQWNFSAWVPEPQFEQRGGNFYGTLDGTTHKMTLNGFEGLHNYIFNVQGGKFHAPSLLRASGGIEVGDPGFYDHANGMVNVFKYWDSWGYVNAPGTVFYDFQFNNLSVNMGDNLEFYILAPFTVQNRLIDSVRGGESSITSSTPEAAVIKVLGDVYLEGGGGTYTYTYPAIMSLEGTGDQVIHGQANTTAPVSFTDLNNHVPFGPTIRINKTQGSVTLKDYVGAASFAVQKVPASLGSDALVTTGSSLAISSPYGYTTQFTPGSYLDGSGVSTAFSFNNLYFAGYYNNVDTDKLTVNGDLYFSSWGHLVGHVDGSGNGISQVNVFGNYYFLPNWGTHDYFQRALTVNMVGAADTVVQGWSGSVAHTHINIQKDPGHTVTLQGVFGTGRNLTVTSGNLVVAPGVPVYIPTSGWNGLTSVFNTPGVTFHDMYVDHNITLASDIILDGDLHFGKYSGGNYSMSIREAVPGDTKTFQLSGNLNIDSGFPYGTAAGTSITFKGANNTTINDETGHSTSASPFGLGLLQFINAKDPAGSITMNSGNFVLKQFHDNSAAPFSMASGTSLKLAPVMWDPVPAVGDSIVGSTINLNGAFINVVNGSGVVQYTAFDATHFKGTVNP